MREGYFYNNNGEVENGSHIITQTEKLKHTSFLLPKQHNSDAYVKSVASKPYSKDPTIRRPLEYTMEKLTHVMEWRESAGAPEMEELVNLANGPETAPEAVEQPEKLTKAKALAVSLNNGSLYWH